ncbi:MAG: cobalt-factor II C(20)-methyltransferase [Methanothrix sp.]|jgi:precorrin-2/cobalt-factor-2 C20-methyltransferase|nr:cobalt-factor II C(20)-methyltransferase [Methanothrix sp.]
MLIGISLGPGDPQLMTIKAAAALKNCTKVFVPGEMAAELARPYCSPEILQFPMIEDKEELERIWCKNADTVAEAAAAGQAGFACIGDVNTFSTFSHLERVIRKNHPHIEIETIPGVGVVPTLASRFAVPLEGSFEVSDGSPVQTVIRIKATRPRKLAEELRIRGFDEFVLGTMLCTAQERIIRDEMPERSDYFSVLLARRRR